jgi:uncharacterized lipoprotein YmbA
MKRPGWQVTIVALTFGLAGCATSPAPGWHSLVPATGAAPATTPANAPATAATRSLLIDAVTVPDEVDRPPLVVRNAAGTPSLLDGERWSEPLKAQLPRALALALAPRLPGTLVVAGTGGTIVLPTWRIVLDVQRFELQRDAPDRAVLRVVWSLRPGQRDAGAPAAPAPQVFETSVPAAGGSPAALVAAMATAIGQLSGQMSQSLTPRPLPPAGEGAAPAR